VKSMDWQMAIPRSPEVGRVQQVAALHGEGTQEYLERVGQVQARQTPRVKDNAGPSAVRDGSGRPRQQHRRDKRRRPHASANPAPEQAAHLDVRV